MVGEVSKWPKMADQEVRVVVYGCLLCSSRHWVIVYGGAAEASPSAVMCLDGSWTLLRVQHALAEDFRV